VAATQDRVALWGSGQAHIYDRLADSWSQASDSGSPDDLCCSVAQAVEEGVLLGSAWASGHSARPFTGYLLDLATGSWTALPTTNAPPAGRVPAIAKVGRTVLAFGGDFAGTGVGLYDLDLGEWTLVGSAAQPERSGARVVGVDGARVFVQGWGDEGGIFDLSDSSWTAWPIHAEVANRGQMLAAYGGGEAFFYGGEPKVDLGYDTLPSFMTGSLIRHDLTTGTWTSDQEVHGPWVGSGTTGSCQLHWHEGTETVFVVGMVGQEPQAGRFDPVAGTWQHVSFTSSPFYSGTRAVPAVASVDIDESIFVWGCDPTFSPCPPAGLYNPALDSWTAVTSEGMPSRRPQPILAWTGTEVVVWSNSAAWVAPSSTGGRYYPASDTWSSISTDGPPVESASVSPVVLPGRRLLLWSGTADGEVVEGGSIYAAATDTWSTISNAYSG
jgi:hypothetical protein